MASNRSFWSWPAGWRKALPWGVLVGGLVAAVLTVLEGFRSGWGSLDRLFWVDLAVLFPVIVVGFTAVAARFWTDRDETP